MTLPTFSTSHPLTTPLSPLTPASFSSFGTVITSPIPAPTSTTTQETIPTTIPPPLYDSQPAPIFANQNTALKTSPISPLTNNYPPSSSTKPASTPLMSLFTCFPRPTSSIQNGNLKLSVLERHPYTTQTFSPLGLSPRSTDTAFIVIVAPTLATSTVNGVNRPPDLTNLQAFVARGDQAVTYGVGTWHAPMIVLGRTRVDFVVTQFVNGTEDDCEEVEVEGVDVEVGGLLEGFEMGISEGKGQERAGESKQEDCMLEARRAVRGKAKL